MRPLPHILASTLALGTVLCAAPPTVNPDAYSGDEDTTLRVPTATGVLSNDAANGNAPLQSLVATNTSHGRLVLNWDGGFKYYPDTNYFGPDEFSYFARKALVFNIKTNVSSVVLAATVTISNPPVTLSPNPQTQRTTAKLAGFIVGNLTPRTTNVPTTLQTAGFQASNLAPNTLTFAFTNFPPFYPIVPAIEVLRVVVNVPTGGVQLALEEPPAVATVTNIAGTGRFDQTNVLTSFDVKGSSTTTINNPLDPPPVTTEAAINLGGVVLPLSFTNSTITSDGTTMTVKLPVNLSLTNLVIEDDPPTRIDVVVTGLIEAAAAAIDNTGEPSAQTFVSLTVNPVDDLPVASPDGYVTLQAAALGLGASSPTNAEILVPQGTNWSYLYTTNTAIITNWNTWAFNDGSWNSGPATLGFGPSNIVTDIRGGGPSNIATAYFRHDFFVDDLSDTLPNVLLSLKRDDAAAVYINGFQVYRDANLASNATHTTFATDPPITGALENAFIDIPVSATNLFDGWNVIAAEVHKRTANENDLRFDCSLTRNRGTGGVLNNDYDIDTAQSALTSVVLVAPQHGTLGLNADGSFSYAPDSGFHGTDSFAYRALDRPEPAHAPQVLVQTNSFWLTWIDGTQPPNNWTNASLVDTNWGVGITEIGYGDEADGRPETTNIRPNSNATVYAAYYFRKRFDSPLDPLFVTNLTGRVLRDDAAAVYLNGVQVYRDANLASNATHNTLATSPTPSETNFADFAISPSLLLQGSNLVAVEIHQASTATSEDLSFEFQLIADVYAGARVTVNVLPDDLDNDLVSDTYERRHGYSPSNPADALLDDDGDGRITRTEFAGDTNPRDRSSFLHASSVTVQGTNAAITFAGTSPDRTYRLQSSTNMIDWANVGDPIDGAALATPLTIPITPGDPRQFYRLQVQLVFP
ncbi:MAG: cadherin-like domain-containing protein [Verrucomicrobiae bacterium]|nr:cadherin-like domain-containing protein [Verrucomicrobiae bacterium]